MPDDKVRLRVILGAGLEKELQWLMEKWGLDRNATVSRIISEAVREAKQKDQEDGKGKGDGERARED
jgi:hypothetical protein